MTDPLELRSELERALSLAAAEGTAYALGLPGDPVLDPASATLLEAFDGPLPEQGTGAVEAVAELAERGRATATRSSGPRFFHFVTGGTTPAALAGDWLTGAFDQSGFAWASSSLAARAEIAAVRWLRELFELPEEFGGAFVTGATMANFTGLVAARGWWAEQCGFDVDDAGLCGAPAPAILSGGYLHPSATQALAMLGLGRATARRLTRDGAGRLDLEALGKALAAEANPAIVIANAGEVNAGDFDPIADVAALCRSHGAWLHVDGAFGLFARLTPHAAHLGAGIEQADSITVDAHKWLNVPYDCGVSFVREPARLGRALTIGAPYLPSPDDPHPNMGFLTPENSRRARALAVLATLRAYGREGYRAMVERHLRLAQHLADRIDREPGFERLAEVKLNIVCFRAAPTGVADEELDDLNRRLGERLLDDGWVFCGTTVYDDKVAFRPAIVNWQTTEEDVQMLVDVLVELLEEEK